MYKSRIFKSFRSLSYLDVFLGLSIILPSTYISLCSYIVINH